MAGVYPNLDASDLESRVRLYLDDVASDFYTSDEIFRWLSIASKDIAQRSYCVKRILDAQTTANTYSVSHNAYKVWSVEYIPSSGRPYTLQKIDLLRAGHIKLNGTTPQFYYELGSLVGIEPTPDAIYNLRLYVSDAPKMVDLSVATFSSGWTAGTGWSASTSASHTGVTVGSLTYSTAYLTASTNYTIEFTVSNIGTGGYVTPYAGTTAGVPVYTNGYHIQNIVSSAGSPSLIFSANNTVSITSVKTYKEGDFSSDADQIELDPSWQTLLPLYAAHKGLVKDKKLQQAVMLESLYKGELAYLKQLLSDIIPDGKVDIGSR